jgi:hypothetical protein
MDVNAIKERAGDALTVLLHLARTASAFTPQVPVKTARAGLRCHFVSQHYVGCVAYKSHTLP